MKTQISNGMFMALVINMIYAKAIGVTQGILARQAGGDMWIISALSTLFGLLVMLLTVVVIKRTPNKNILEQSKILLGKWGEKFLGIILFLFFLGAFGGVMITFVYHLMDYFLPDAPAILFIFLAVIAGMLGLLYGIEIIGRIAIIGTFSAIILNILILLGSLHYFDIKYFFPLIRTGMINNVLATEHYNADWAMATLMAGIIFPMVKDKNKWFGSSTRAMVYGGLLILMWPILQIGILSPEVTGQAIVSCMQVARSAEIGLFIHRYELIMVIFFSLSSLVQIIVCLFCATASIKHVFNIQNITYLSLPVTLILGAFGYWVIKDHIRAMDLLTYYWPIIANPIAFGVPIVLFLLGLIFKKKLKKSNKNQTKKEDSKDTISKTTTT